MIIHQYIEKYNFYKKNNLTEESKNSLYSTMLLINDFFNDINVIVSEAKEAMAKTSKEIRPCDPQYHQRGVTYEPLVNFIQAQLYRGCFADPLAFDCDKKTNINTQFVNPNDKERKVQYFAVDKGLRVMGIGPSKHVKEFGNSTNIENLEKKTTEYYCIPTICYVDDKDNEYTVRKFSLNTAKASDGYVVTGVKLSLKNRIFYIDIQEGKLLQGVLVDPDSLRWKNTIESNDNVITLDRNHSSVNIDDVYLPNGSFVTGLKFLH
ncbi:uncharacterized protein LOC122849424 [Aphidius gifuensis]|uniref:uncharacterized protein LOC122849424 n=1 Tax=Aphidius gifuensis TaxID=684658 RepID=UPI001CDD5B7D|nr:uncharacterized protein LOC122849424 [Aphidius gifuensis]